MSLNMAAKWTQQCLEDKQVERLDLAWKEFAISKSKNLLYILTGCEFSTLIMTCVLFNDSKLSVSIKIMTWHLKMLVTRRTICSPNIISLCVHS